MPNWAVRQGGAWRLMAAKRKMQGASGRVEIEKAPASESSRYKGRVAR
jgi:hypothetical protein